jgi:hypothetical protein
VNSEKSGSSRKCDCLLSKKRIFSTVGTSTCLNDDSAKRIRGEACQPK